MAGAGLPDGVESNSSAECGKHVVSTPGWHLRLLFSVSYLNTLYRSINSVLILAPKPSVQIPGRGGYSLGTLEKYCIGIKSTHDTGTEGQHQPQSCSHQNHYVTLGIPQHGDRTTVD